MEELTAPDRFFASNGDIIGSRYRIIDMVGEGTFSNVYTCKDLDSGEKVVVKVCRATPQYDAAAKDEISAMNFLRKIDPNHRYFVNFIDSFRYKSHTCIVLELLGPSLMDNVRYLKHQGFSIDTIRIIMRQIVSGVAMLHHNEKIHTDLKLENILLKGNLIDSNGYDIKTHKFSPDVRLVDFGSLDTGKIWHTHLATTRHYRAPEILLGLKWGYEADIWSIGCILVELALGSIPFDSRDTLEHLFLIQYIIEDIPRYMWDRCTDRMIVSHVRRGKLSQEVIYPEHKHSFLIKPKLEDLLRRTPDLADLACMILRTDPMNRPRAEDILDHKFFRNY